MDDQNLFMRKMLICFFGVLIIGTHTAYTQRLNLDIEEVDAYAQPGQWGLGHSQDKMIVYRLLADSVTKHSGQYSMKIFSTSAKADFGSCYLQIPLPLKGKNITLKGFLKTENVNNGYARLFMALINDSTVLRYDNMQERGLSGTSDWKEFSISLDLVEGVNKINLGAFITGPGILWVDDLALTIDDKKITNSPILQVKFPK